MATNNQANNQDEDFRFDSAAPIMASGLDIDKLLSGDARETQQALSQGLPLFTSGFASGSSMGINTPAPAGTAAEQKQGTPLAVPPKAIMPPAQAPARPASTMDGLGGALAQTQAPAVPASITPSGTQDDENQQGIQRAGKMAESFSEQLASQPTLEQKVAPIQAQRTLPPQEFDPAHPEYAPTAGRRILRGLIGAGEGLARGGIRGALLGGLDPGAVGATPYSAPTRQFSIAAQRQAAQHAALDKQQETATTAYKEDTGRAKDVITTINDVGKNNAAGETAKSREDIAGAREQKARVQSQLADVKQQVADYMESGKPPTTYEATVAAAHLEKDPDRAARMESAAKEMATQRTREAFIRHQRATAGPNDALRQPMIDAATAQVQALQGKYEYDPRRNQYVNNENPNDVLDPSEFTDKKNVISTKLDQQLEQKKLPKLGVRFDPNDAGGNKPSGRAARRAAQQGAGKTNPAPEKTVVKMPNGGFQVKSGGKWVNSDQSGKPI